MNFRNLFLRIRALVAPRRVERELDEELAFHIERETQKHLSAGLSPADARTRAIARFGPVPLAADQCRDARGTGFVDNLTRDILYAFRTFRRAPLAALTIIATIGLGLGLINVVFTVYNTIFLRADAVRSPGELFAVERRTGPGADASLPFTWPEYDALRRETSVFTDAFAMLRPVRTRIEGRVSNSDLVTGNFFQVLGVQAALGRPLTPGDDERFAGRPVIVLSHSGWNKLFGGNPAVIGRSLLVNGLPYEIVGVMPEDFRGLGILPPDYWAPLALAGQFRDAYIGREDQIAIDVTGRLKPGMSPEAARAGLTIWATARSGSPSSTAWSRRGATRRRRRREGGPWASRLHQAETEPGHPLGQCAPGADDLLADLLRLRADPDDWLRQRRQLAARTRCHAPAGDRHQAVGRSVTPAHHPATAHGKSPPCARSGGMRSGGLARVSTGCALCGDHHGAAGAPRGGPRRVRARCR
jgi:hypothetical protein